MHNIVLFKLQRKQRKERTKYLKNFLNIIIMKAMFFCLLLFSIVMLNHNTLVDGRISYDDFNKFDKNAHENFKKVTERNNPPSKGREEANKYNRGCSHITRCRG